MYVKGAYFKMLARAGTQNECAGSGPWRNEHHQGETQKTHPQMGFSFSWAGEF